MRKTEVEALVAHVLGVDQIVLLLLRGHCVPNLVTALVAVNVP